MYFFRRAKAENNKLSGKLVDSCNYLSFYLASEQLVDEQFGEMLEDDFASTFNKTGMLKEDWNW